MKGARVRFRVQVIGSEKLYSGAVSLRMDRFSLGGRVIEKEIVEHQPSVGVVPVLDNHHVLLVTQYRRAAGKTLLEIPAGKIEKGETASEAALREMAEEIGYTGTLSPLLGCYLAPGYDTEFMRVFVARNLRKVRRGSLDDDENIKVRKMTIDSAVRKCFSGRIQDCKTIAALLAYSSSRLAS